MTRPRVVVGEGDRLMWAEQASNSALLQALRDDCPEFVREQVEAELLRRLDRWAMGLER